MKLPKLPKFAFPRRPKKLQASTTANRRAPAADDYYDEEPKTNLSSAFVVVLVLHVVAVGGIYAFNSIKAARRGEDPIPAQTTPPPAGAALATKAAPPDPTEPVQPIATPATPAPKPTVYRVQPGDTLTKIAALHGVTVADFEEANDLKDANGLRIGQTLKIPVAKAAPPAVAQDSRKAAFLAAKNENPPAVSATTKAGVRTYTVVKGDTPTTIARKFNISSAELLKLNKIDDAKKMQLGQTLKLPPAKKN